MTQYNTQLEAGEERIRPLKTQLDEKMPQLKVLQERIGKLMVRECWRGGVAQH